MKHLNADSAAVRNQVFGQEALRSGLCDAQEASSRLEARCRVVGEHAKTTKRLFLQILQRLTVAQAKLAHEKSRSKTFEDALLNQLSRCISGSEFTCCKYSSVPGKFAAEACWGLHARFGSRLCRRVGIPCKYIRALRCCCKYRTSAARGYSLSNS